jgi:hypothetical protein
MASASAPQKLTGAIKTAERKLAHGSLRAEIDVVGRGKCSGRGEGQRHHHTRQACGSAKIDPLMAAQCYLSDVSNPWTMPGSTFVI